MYLLKHRCAKSWRFKAQMLLAVDVLQGKLVNYSHHICVGLVGESAESNKAVDVRITMYDLEVT